jgi:hypothetical protein
MADIAPSVLEQKGQSDQSFADSQVWNCVNSLFGWLEANNFSGYDAFDGLNSRLLRPLTFENPLLRTVLQQGVRRFPLNLRPLLGIPKSRSTKGMGFLARGYIRLHRLTGDAAWADRAVAALDWLIENSSQGYSGPCWGNHFDYQSRVFYLPKNVPIVVWTSLIGQAFLEGWEDLHDARYLDTAVSACEHIVRDLEVTPDGEGACISYLPGQNRMVHNANTLGACLLARTYAHTRNESYRALAQRAMQYTAQYQRPDGSWYYGEKSNLHWVDNFHSGYVLDCFKHYAAATGDTRFDAQRNAGYDYWKRTFFLPDGTPRYYSHKTLPIDIQCCAQAIDTLALFSDDDSEAVPLALKIARWTVANMQDKSGYFYYRRYSSWLVNKTPTLHWGQATMFCALTNLLQSIESRSQGQP